MCFTSLGEAANKSLKLTACRHSYHLLLVVYGRRQLSSGVRAPSPILSLKQLTAAAYDLVWQNNPGSQAYIIAYRGRDDLPGVSARYSRRIKNYLFKNRGIDPDRVVLINAGRHEAPEIKVEIWLVPAGASSPPLNPTLPPQQLRPDIARKFDQTLYCMPGNDSDAYWSGHVEDQAAQLGGFAQALLQEPNSRGYMIAYTQ